MRPKAGPRQARAGPLHAQAGGTLAGCYALWREVALRGERRQA